MDRVPSEHTCDGANTSPPLIIRNIPAGGRGHVASLPRVTSAMKRLSVGALSIL